MFSNDSKKIYTIVLALTVLVMGAFIWMAAALTAGEEPAGAEPETSAPVTGLRPAEREGGAGAVRISEVMARNHTVYRDETGAFPDWIELENVSAEEVDLTGWKLSDEREDGWTFPETIIGPGEFLLICADGNNSADGTLHADFSLSPDETVYLFTPGGFLEDKLSCSGAETNHSVVKDAYGRAEETAFATPGRPNTKEGYELFSAGQTAPGPLIISEVMVSNLTRLPLEEETYDWVEITNVSDKSVELSDYFLSDHGDELLRWRFPKRKLAPGAFLVVYCSGDASLSTNVNIHTDFSLNAREEDLYLTRSDGELTDWVYLRGIPADGSMGRMKGQGGWFYFPSPSPKAENKGGYRRISAAPEALSHDGIWEDVKSVSVKLEASGEIYYTLDGSLPTEKSARYTGPFEVSETCVVKAVAVEPDAAPSRPLNLCFIINEGHTLPVLSLVTDEANKMEFIYRTGKTGQILSGTAGFFEPGGGGFTAACGVSMRGHTSLKLPKKSLGVDFTGFADGAVDYDLFGAGVQSIAGLSVRAGQDYSQATIRDELFQDLCLEAGNRALAQRSRWCALYLNGEYYGTYALKENYSRRYYASLLGTERDTVTMLNSPVSVTSALYKDVIELCRSRDMSVKENYELLCSRLDVNSLIDWILLEGYSCNSDINGNIRYFHGGRPGDKWQIAYYDLDWTFRVTGNCLYNVVFQTGEIQIGPVVDKLLKNPDFREALYDRCRELCGGILSNEHVLAEIDRQRDIIAPEAARDRARWSSSVSTWERSLAELRAFVTENDMENLLMDRVKEALEIASASE